MPPTSTATVAERQQIRGESRIVVTDDQRQRLEAFITEWVGKIETLKSVKREKVERTRRFLRGENPDPPARQGVSNVSVPLLMWARSAMRARLTRGIVQHEPPIAFRPAGQREEDREFGDSLARLGRAFVNALKNPRELNGIAVLDKVSGNMCDIGTGAWAVVANPDEYRNIMPPERTDRRVAAQRVTKEGARAPQRIVKRGGVQWVHIPWDQLVYFDGYGTDYNAMPFVGYWTHKTWAQIQHWAALDHYDKQAVAAVEGLWVGDEMPAMLRQHRVLEAYIDWDVNDDGDLEAVGFDYHMDAQRILRIFWNQFDGRRPIVGAQFDLPALETDHNGQGVGEKLDSPQTETNMLHNTFVEIGKHCLHIVVGRRDSGIDEELDDDEPIVPSEFYTSENPKEDLTTHALADPRFVEPGMAIEASNLQYVFRLLGFDESQLGNLESGKRVPASLGLPIRKDARTVTENAIKSLGNAVQEAVYLTLLAWRRRLPARALRTVLRDEDIAVLDSTVFSLNDPDLRDSVLVHVEAQDVASAEDSRRQGLLLHNQFILGVYDRIIAYIEKLAAVPQARPIMDLLLDKLLASVRLQVKMVEEVTDPEDVLPSVREMQAALDEVFGAQQPALRDNTGGVQ